MQVLVYHLLGYLLPGIIILSAIILLFWTLLGPTLLLQLPGNMQVLPLIGLLLLAYPAGYLGQAMGSFLEKLPKPKQVFQGSLPLCPELYPLFRHAVARRFGESTKFLTPKELYDLCDQALISHGIERGREISICRESFYRSNAVAFFLLTLSLTVRLMGADVFLTFANMKMEIDKGGLALAAVITALGTWAAYRRYVLFCRYRLSSCFLRYLAVVTEAPGHSEGNSAALGCPSSDTMETFSTHERRRLGSRRISLP